MSVTESDIVDGIAIGSDEKTLIMLITDHLGWEGEFEFDHFVILQEKINSYLRFIQSKQYNEVFSDREFDFFVIEIRFLHDITDNCYKFLNTVANQVEPLNVRIEAKRKLMLLEDVLHWLENEFRYPVPEDYLNFLISGDFTTTLRKNYIVDLDSKSVVEISEWFAYDSLSFVYNNCLEEEMIKEHQLPIFDSCGCTIILDCNDKGKSFGCVFSRSPVGYFDERLEKNVYTEFDSVSESFSEILTNLKTTEELEELGL